MIGLAFLRSRPSAGTLGADRRGVALIEFAITLPILVLLFVGSYQLLDAISTYRKVTTTVRTLADLTTQSTSMTASGANDIMNASQQVMTPYSTTTAVLRITQVQIKNDGTATVGWSRAVNGTGYTPGSAVTVPSGISVPNTNLIYSEISFNYVPKIASVILGPITFRDNIYMSPRNSQSIPCADC